jgi:hypothetical protein
VFYLVFWGPKFNFFMEFGDVGSTPTREFFIKKILYSVLFSFLGPKI